MHSVLRNAVRQALLASLLLCAGCQIHGVLKPENPAASMPGVLISSIDLVDGRTIRFDRDTLGYASCNDSVVSRALTFGQVETYPLSQISKIHTVRPSTTAEDVMTGIALGVAAFLALLVVMGPIHISLAG